jgi:Predicted transcriptional regulators
LYQNLIYEDINMKDYKDALYKIIGNRIKSLREDLGQSQYELSQKLEISRSSISNIEVGRHQIPLYLLYEISEVLRTDIKLLLPTPDEINSFMNNDANDYSALLNSIPLEDKQKEILNQVIKNI